MIILLLVVLLVLITAFAVFAAVYAIRWARIIMALEDELGTAIEVHERSISTFEKVLKTPLFFDSPEVRPILTEALADIKVCKLATQSLIQAFTRMSKQQYSILREDDDDARR